MPNIKSSKKRMDTSAAARLKNRSTRTRIRSAIKRVRQAESHEDAQARLRDATVLLDRAATKHIFHPNRVARLKSQLSRHVNSLAG